jgi:hypothetical protein
MNNLLTPQERKAIIDRLVDNDAAEYFSIAIGDGAGDAGTVRKNIRKLYNKLDDAKLLSIKI